MKFDAKIYYVNGVYDGLAGAPSLVESNDEAERLRATVGKVFRGIEAAQMVKAVDGFYRVSANREIPISGAVIYCAIVGWSGVPQATKDAFLHELRTRKK